MTDCQTYLSVCLYVRLSVDRSRERVRDFGWFIAHFGHMPIYKPRTDTHTKKIKTSKKKKGEGGRECRKKSRRERGREKRERINEFIQCMPSFTRSMSVYF